MTNPKVAAEELNDSINRIKLKQIIEGIDVVVTYKFDALPKVSIGTKTATDKVLAWHNQQVITLLQELRKEVGQYYVSAASEYPDAEAVPLLPIDEVMKRYCGA